LSSYFKKESQHFRTDFFCGICPRYILIINDVIPVMLTTNPVILTTLFFRVFSYRLMAVKVIVFFSLIPLSVRFCVRCVPACQGWRLLWYCHLLSRAIL